MGIVKARTPGRSFWPKGTAADAPGFTFNITAGSWRGLKGNNRSARRGAMHLRPAVYLLLLGHGLHRDIHAHPLFLAAHA
jgi:hypothetical protein